MLPTDTDPSDDSMRSFYSVDALSIDCRYTAAIVPRTIRLSFDLFVSKNDFITAGTEDARGAASHYIRDGCVAPS